MAQTLYVILARTVEVNETSEVESWTPIGQMEASDSRAALTRHLRVNPTEEEADYVVVPHRNIKTYQARTETKTQTVIQEGT